MQIWRRKDGDGSRNKRGGYLISKKYSIYDGDGIRTLVS